MLSTRGNWRERIPWDNAQEREGRSQREAIEDFVGCEKRVE